MPKRRLVAAAVAVALGVPVSGSYAQSVAPTTLPTGWNVVGGQAKVNQSGAAMQVQQGSARAAIDWQSFNIGSQASVTFNQPSASAIALNRVLGASGSEIYGRLSANGQVFLINPNGVLFARGSQVDVGGIVASTLWMSPDDFMSGRNVLRNNGAAGSVTNQGEIRGRSVVLVGPKVVNEGLIEAQSGAINLTAANAATLDFMADGLIQIRVDEGAIAAEVANSGTLRADGGSVTLTAKSLDNLARSVVNNTGIIEARTVQNVGGVVRLGGDDVLMAGTVDAHGAEGKGGSVKLLGERVGLTDTARIDASGDTGGGEVLIGGNYQGKGPEQNAIATYVGRDVTIDASAGTRGDGGKVIVWADNATRFYGSIKTTGGAQGGDGGFVETSGKQWLDFQGRVDTRAVLGRTGTLLLDPTDITISTAATNNGACLLTACFTLVPLINTAVLNITDLTNALGSTNVSVNTSNPSATGNGDISVNTAVSWNSGNSLSLVADRNIALNSGVTNAGTGAINLQAVNTLTVGANLSSGGAVNISAANATFNAGTADLSGTLNVSGTTTVAGSSTVKFTGTLTSLGNLLSVTGGTADFGTQDVTATNYTQTAGTLSGTGVLTVLGTTTLSGGTMNGPGSTITVGALAINTNGTNLDGGRVLDVQGGASWSAGNINLNSNTQAGSGTIINRSTSTFTATGDNFLFASNFGGSDNGLTALFDNQGTFVKTGGTATTFLQTAFNNSGSMDVRSGTVDMTQGGTHTGSFTGGGTLQFGGGIHSLSATSSVTMVNTTFSGGTADVGGTYNVSGTTLVNGGAANFTGTLASLGATLNITSGTADVGTANATVSSFTQIGGTLSGSGNLTVSGATTLSGGTMSGSGSTITVGALTIDTSGTNLDGGRVLDVQGGATWSGGNINLNSSTQAGSGTLINRGGSTFTATGDNFIFASNFGGSDNGLSALFDNQGSFVKTGGTATTFLQTAFNNRGGVDVRSGTLDMTLGGTHTGSFTGGGTLQFGGGIHTVTNTSSVTTSNATFTAGTADVGGTYNVSGTTLVNGGTANFTGTLTSLGATLSITSGTADVGTANATVSSFTQSGGTLSGSGNLTVSGATTLSGGTMTGPGSTITQGALTINVSGTNLDAGRVLDVQGGATWSAGNINLNSNSVPGSGTIINRPTSTFTTTFDGSMFTQNFGGPDNGQAALFDNQGTFAKTGGTFTTTVSNAFNNSGALNVLSGTVNLTGGGVHSGSFSTVAGTTLQFGGGTHDVNNASAVNSLGRLLFSSGTVNTTGTLTSGGLIEITSGILNAGGAISTVTYTQSGGTLDGSGNLAVSGATTLSGGTMTGPGSTITQGALTINVSGTNLDAGRVLDIQGGATWSAGNINLNSNSVPGSGTIINRPTSTFTTTFDGSMFTQNFGGPDNGASALFDNQGTFQKTGLTGTTTITNAFNNSGALNVLSGTLSLNGGGTHSGSFSTASGTTLQFNGGTHDVNNASAVNSLGRILMSSGIVNTAGTLTSGGLIEITNGTLNAGGAINTVTYTQSAGTLAGTGNVTVSGATALSGGTMTGPASTITQGALTISSSGTNLDGGRVLDIQGGATWSSGNINLNANSVPGSGTIINRPTSTFTNTFDGNMFTQSFGGPDNGQSALFDNQGTFVKSGGPGSTFVQNPFNNSGALNVQSGTLALTSGGTHSGSFSTVAGTTLQFAGGTHDVNNASAVNSLGRLLFSAGTVNTTGTLSSGGLIELTGSLLNAGGDINTVTYTQSGGTLSGAGNLTVSGATALSGGIMAGSGTTITQGALAISGGGIGLDAGRVLDIQGGATWSSGAINLNAAGTPGSGTVINRPSSTLTQSFDGVMFTQSFGGPDDGSTALFDNQGVFQKTAGIFTSTISNALTNSGAIVVQSGALNVTNFPTNAGKILLVNNTTFATNGNSLTNAAAGLIEGIGTVSLGSGTLTNSGTVRPGGQATVGTLAVSGNYSQSGALEVDLQSGTVFDVLAVTGSATLGGTLNVNYLGGYTGAGNDHTVMTYASHAGAFASINDPNFLAAIFNPTVFLLSAQVLNIWINPGSGDWSVGSNWSLGHEPSPTEAAQVPDLTGSQTISVLSAAHTPKSFVFAGDETLTLNGGSLAFSSASSINNGSLVLSGGTLTADAPLSVRNLDLASGLLNGSGSLNVTNAYSQSAGVVNIGGVAQITHASGALNLGAIAASAISVSALSGNINVGGPLNAPGGIALSTTGAITQSGVINTTALQTTSANGQILDLNNAVDTFSAVNTGSGNIALTNSVPLTVGNITAGGGGSVILNNSAPVTIAGVVLGGPVTVSANGMIHVAVGASIGVAGNNASSITLNAGGTGSDIVLGGDLFASPGPIALNATGSITQVAGVMDTVGTLTGAAGGSVSLGMDNTISNLGNFTAGGSFTLHERLGTGLTVTGGVSASGPAKIANAIGGIDVQGAVQSSAATVDAVVLSAGDGTPAGTAAGGDVSFGPNGFVSVGGGGRATIFTGSLAGSTGVATAAGLGNSRYNSDPNVAGYTSPLGSGIYAIYREQPTLTITAVGPSSMVYGSGVPAYTSTVSGFVNGDTAAQALAVGATVADDGIVSTSGNLTAANHVITPSGAVDQLGYGISYVTGTLTVAKASISSIVGLAGNTRVYDGTVNATVNASGAVFTGQVPGDLLTVGSATAVFNDRNVGAGKPISVTSMALGGADAGNYTLAATTASTTGAITPRPLVVSGAPDTKVYDGNTTSAALASVSGLVGGDTASFSQAYDTKDVGAGKTMTPLGGVVSDGNGGANYSVSFVGSPVGVIAQLASVSWTGAGGSNLWSNPANWAGNAIPDRANVASVDLAGAAVVFDAAVPSLGNQVSVSNVSGGTLSANGGALTLAVAGNASLSGYSQASGTTAIGGDLTISSPGASITQTGGTLVVGGNTSLNAGANSIALPSGSNSFGGVLTASATGGINIVTGGVLIPGTINAGTGTVTLTAAGIGAGGPIVARDAALSSSTPVSNLQVAVTDSLVLNGSAPTWRILDTSSPSGFTTLQFATLFENGVCITGPLCGTTVSELTGFTPQSVINSLPTNTTPYTPTIPDASVATATAVAPYQVASVASTPVPLPSGLPRFPITPAMQLLMDDMEQMRSRKKQALEEAVKILERDPTVADLKACVGDEISGTCIAQRPAKPHGGEAKAVPADAALPAIERKVALLIGVNDYRGAIPKLDSPLKDIEDIAKLYREQFGYEVRTLRDADKASIVRELNRLIVESGPNDSITVFYAGHGQLIEKTGRGYWIPAKASADNPAEWISNADIGRALEAISAKQLLLVSDSCYSGTLTREAKLDKGEVLADPAQVLARRAVTVLTSGGEEPVADAGKDGHSVFAWHFMKTLQTVTKWQGGVDIYQELSGAVQQDFPQEPQYGASTAAGHERGADFLFEVRKPEPK